MVSPALTSDVLVANSTTRRLIPLREHQRSSWLISSLLRTAMKEGLLGDRLGVSSRSEHEEARFVCCTLGWI
jgi:hypothetical protein